MSRSEIAALIDAEEGDLIELASLAARCRADLADKTAALRATLGSSGWMSDASSPGERALFLSLLADVDDLEITATGRASAARDPLYEIAPMRAETRECVDA